jgi:hypothetical protein
MRLATVGITVVPYGLDRADPRATPVDETW